MIALKTLSDWVKLIKMHVIAEINKLNIKIWWFYIFPDNPDPIKYPTALNENNLPNLPILTFYN